MHPMGYNPFIHIPSLRGLPRLFQCQAGVRFKTSGASGGGGGDDETIDMLRSKQHVIPI